MSYIVLACRYTMRAPRLVWQVSEVMPGDDICWGLIWTGHTLATDKGVLIVGVYHLVSIEPMSTWETSSINRYGAVIG